MAVEHRLDDQAHRQASSGMTSNQRLSRSPDSLELCGEDSADPTTDSVQGQLITPVVVAVRQRHDRTHLIVDAAASRYHVTVSVARDHSTGRAIGFRYWIRNERVTLQEQQAIDAAVRDIALLSSVGDTEGGIAAVGVIADVVVQPEVVEERRQPKGRR